VVTNVGWGLYLGDSHASHPKRHDGLFHEIIDGGMRGKPTRGRRIQMPHDLANDVGSDALKRAAEDRDTEKGC